MAKGNFHLSILQVITCASILLIPCGKCHNVKPICDKDAEICEVHFEMKEHSTMMKLWASGGQYKRVVTHEDGSLWVQVNLTHLHPLPPGDLDDVPLGDGSHKRVLLYNGQLPGPPIIVYEGQQVVVRLKNSMVDQATTMHFHGLKQLHTPWMDGVSGVSQCNINPGETFTYRFLASPVGTHWYHSHYGTQRSQGAAGVFVVLDRNNDMDRRKLDLLPQFDRDYYIMMQDWYREANEDTFIYITYDTVKFPYNYRTDICYNSTKQADGVDSGVIPFESIVINGRGRYDGQNLKFSEKTYLPYEVFEARRGTFIRFRAVTASLMFPMRVSVDGHALYVIATDGDHVRKQKMDSIIVFNGERYDFYIEANDPQAVGNYWIRVQNLIKLDNGKKVAPGIAKAILRYEGAPVEEPRTTSRPCTAANPCDILNCPYELVTPEDHWVCHPVTVLRGVNNKPTLQPEEGEELHEYFLNFHFAFPVPGVTEKPTINGVQHRLAVASPMTFPEKPDVRERCEFVSCPTGLCRECEHRLNLPLNKVIQFNVAVTINNEQQVSRVSGAKNEPGAINGNDHPLHIHGHQMQILKVAYPTYDPVTYFYANTSDDFTCTKEDCNTLYWTDPSWTGGNVPGLLQEGAPEKDTVVLPVGGYVVTRFKTDNPGYWYMHCHVEFHNAEGMALVIKAGEEEEMNPPPAGMPTCGDFYLEDEEEEDEQEEDKNDTDQPIRCQAELMTVQKYKIASGALGLSCLFIIFLILHILCNNKLREQGKGTYTEVGAG